MSIEISNLTKRYGEAFSLHLPRLFIAPGTTLGLVGNNGAGKTTLLRLILDLLEADEGTVRILGTPVTENDSWKMNVGSYLDASFLLDYLTPREFYAFVGSVYGLKSSQVDDALIPYQSFLSSELTSNQKFVRDLSTGSAKKVGIVSAMFLNPKVLILDEPFANLDPGSQLALKRILQNMRDQGEVTMIVSSHDLAHVTDVCERVAILERGKIVEDMRTSDETLNTLEAYFTKA